MFTLLASVRPEPERTSAEPSSVLLKLLMLSSPQTSGQELTSSSLHSSSTPESSSCSLRRSPEAETEREEEVAVATEEAEAVEVTEVEEAAEAAVVDPDPEVVLEQLPLSDFVNFGESHCIDVCA